MGGPIWYRRCEGQGDGKGRTLTHVARHSDLATHGRDHTVGEPQTDAEAGPPMLSDHLLKPPEDTRLLVRRHADAPVLHVQLRRSPVRAEPNGYGLACSKLERVRKQVLDHLLDRKLIQDACDPALDVELDWAARVGSHDVVFLGDR